MPRWLLYLLLGLTCNVSGIVLHYRGHETAALVPIIIGILLVAASFFLHLRTFKSDEDPPDTPPTD